MIIYQIENLINGKKYIGQSKCDFNEIVIHVEGSKLHLL